eukprot:9765673-Karenia_brevis.AAC.1
MSFNHGGRKKVHGQSYQKEVTSIFPNVVGGAFAMFLCLLTTFHDTFMRGVGVRQILVDLEAWATDITKCLQDNHALLNPEHHTP